MAVISVINNKGGVGKTTTVFTLGAYFASKGFSVLMLDFDAQASLTEKAQHNDNNASPNDFTIINYLQGANRALFYSDSTGLLKTMQGSKEINEFLTVNKQDFAKKYRDKRTLFRDSVGLLKNIFDIILIDCAPGMFDEQLLTPNEVALMGSDYVLIPIMADMHSITGITKVGEAIKRIKADNPSLSFLGSFFTNIRTEEKLYIGYEETLRNMIGDFLLPAPIRRSAEMQQALSKNMTIFDYRPGSIAAQDYSRLGEVILKRIGKTKKPKQRLTASKPA